MSSPTQRSLKLLRKLGWTCQVVERWNAFAKLRQDLFGFCDVLAMQPGNGFLAIQCCAASSQAARAAKIKAEPRARTWIEAGGRIFVHGWGPRKVKRGGKAIRYEVNEIEIMEKDLCESTLGSS